MRPSSLDHIANPSSGSGTLEIVTLLAPDLRFSRSAPLLSFSSVGGTWGASSSWLFTGRGSAPYGSTRDFTGNPPRIK
jgi:hypothetical protein